MAKLNGGQIHAARLKKSVLGETYYTGEISLNVGYENGDVFGSGSVSLALLLGHVMKHAELVVCI